MNTIRFHVLSALVLGSLTVVACGAETVNVGSSEQLLRKSDGGATGDGGTCSFDDSVSSDGNEVVGNGAAVPGDGSYAVGETFPSPDGCNTCSCTAEGIACTEKACNSDAGSVACTDEAKLCPDGTYVSRVAPSCEFAPCGGGGDIDAGSGPGPGACPADAKLCPDGSYVVRTGPDCEFAPCP